MAAGPSRKGRFNRFLQGLTGSLEMPGEVMLDLPRATLIGTMQVQIENHKGIVEYQPTRIRIRTRDGELVVSGSRLRIGSIFKDEVVIEGRIASLDLARQGASEGAEG